MIQDAGGGFGLNRYGKFHLPKYFFNELLTFMHHRTPVAPVFIPLIVKLLFTFSLSASLFPELILPAVVNITGNYSGFSNDFFQSGCR